MFKNIVSALASSSLDSKLIIWDLETGKIVHDVGVGPVDVWKVAFSPDDSHVISGSHTGQIHIYSLKTGKKERVLDTRGQFAMSVTWVSLVFSKEGK